MLWYLIFSSYVSYLIASRFYKLCCCKCLTLKFRSNVIFYILLTFVCRVKWPETTYDCWFLVTFFYFHIQYVVAEFPCEHLSAPSPVKWYYRIVFTLKIVPIQISRLIRPQLPKSFCYHIDTVILNFGIWSTNSFLKIVRHWF